MGRISKKQRLFEVIAQIDNSFKQSLNETTDDDWTFFSRNVEIDDMDGFKEKFYPQAEYVDAYGQKVDVTWHIIPEIRDFGIKDMSILVDKISGYIYYTVTFPDENREDEEGQIDVGKYQWEFDVEMENLKFGDGVYPTSVRLDFQTMKCIAIFD